MKEKNENENEVQEVEKGVALLDLDHSKYTKFAGVSRELIEVLLKTKLKGFTMSEVYVYLDICQMHDFDPKAKLIWAYKGKDWTDRNGNVNRGEVSMFCGRDGYLLNATRSKLFRGMSSAEIRENDTFEADFANNTVIHKIVSAIDRGDVVGAWAVVHKHEMPSKLAVMYAPEYDPDSKWKNKAAMCKKVAEAEALRKQFPLHSIQSEYDWDLDEDGNAYPKTIKPITEKHEDLVLESALAELLDAADNYVGEDKERLVKEIKAHIRQDTMDIHVVEKYMDIFDVPAEMADEEQ